MIVGLVVALALFFDFTNGFHDTANAIATVVSTKVLTPRAALDPLGIAAEGVKVGEDVARPYAIDTHALARHFLGQAQGEGVQRALGGGVVDLLVGRTQPRGHR